MQSDHKRFTYQIDNLWKSLLDKRKNYMQVNATVNAIEHRGCTVYADFLNSKWNIIDNKKEQKFSKLSQPHIQTSSPSFPIKTKTKPQDLNQSHQFTDNMNKYCPHQNFTSHRHQLPLQSELNNNREVSLFKNVPFIQQPNPITSNNAQTAMKSSSVINTVAVNLVQLSKAEKETPTERGTITYQDKAPLPTPTRQLPFNITNSSSLNHSSSNNINVLGKKTQREMPKEASKKSNSKTLCVIDLRSEAQSQQTPPILLQDQSNPITSQVR